MNTDLITLYTPELLKAFVFLTGLLFGANILQAIAAIIAKGRLQEAEGRMQEAEDGKQAALDMLKHATDKAASIHAERDTWKKTAKEVEADRYRILAEMKEVQKTAAYWIDAAERLKSERATLYFRNAKGQIEPITPKPRKQAKRIKGEIA
jgi:transcriptional regulator with GAF, ATPase, and Fis domain